MLGIMVLEEGYKIEQVGGIEGAVCKTQETFEVGIFMVEDELVGLVVHPVH